MSDQLTERLNAILPRITSAEFLGGSGIGNEVPFYIFDYPPEAELRVREHVRFLLQHVPKQKPGLRMTHVNLFDLVIEYLDRRGYLQSSLKTERESGKEVTLKRMEGMLNAEKKIAPEFVAAARPDRHDLVLVSGVGSVWPLLRTHQLLSKLQAQMGRTPLVMFYPGRYDGKYLRLFGKLQNVDHDPYYRAFKLVP